MHLAIHFKKTSENEAAVKILVILIITRFILIYSRFEYSRHITRSWFLHVSLLLAPARNIFSRHFIHLKSCLEFCYYVQSSGWSRVWGLRIKRVICSIFRASPNYQQV